MCKNIIVVFLRLKKKIFFLLVFIACFMMLSLITFYPFDDSYFQYTGNDHVHNFFGRYGAVCSDILFFLFGLLAYIFPCVMFFLIWDILFKNVFLNIVDVVYKIIGGIILLFSLCGLIEFFVKEFYYCYSGGIIGFFVRTQIFYIFKNDMIINVILFFFLIFGVILLTQCSWWLILKKIIFFILNFFVCYYVYLVNQCSRYDSKTFFSIMRTICNSYVVNFFRMLLNKFVICDAKHFIIFRCLLCRLHLSNIFFNNFKLNNEDKLCDVNNLNYKNKTSVYHNDDCYQNYAPINKDCVRMNNMQSPINISSHINNTQLLLQKMVNVFPSIDLLFPSYSKKCMDMNVLKQQSELLELKLAEYHIQARVVNILQGPVVTRFELDLAPGLKSSRISSLSRDLARSLSMCDLRIIEVIPSKPYVGVEIPNKHRKIVCLREVLDTEQFRSSCDVLTIGLGKDVSGEPVIVNLSDMPHLLIAGTTGSGKSVGINSIIVSILYKATPEDVRFIMIDPKILELSVYKDIPHLLTNVITDIKSVITVLNWCVDEMDRRYKIMAYYGARNLKNCNERIKFYNGNEFTIGDSPLSINNTVDNTLIGGLKNKLPYIVIIIDEFADLVMSAGKQVELLIVRLSQKARACGMHLILATQRPSVNVITGLIKANIPSRIAFTVSSKIDSRTILDQSGAESLLGMGDMLYLPSYSSAPIRVHGAFVSDEEVLLVVKYLKNLSCG